MKRNLFRIGTLVALGCLCAALPLGAQSSAVRITTRPAGLQFTIDGQVFTGATDYIWVLNSKHFISSYDQYAPDKRIRYTYLGSSSNLDTGLVGGTLPITANPAVKSITVSFEQDDLLTILIFDCSSYDPGPCPSPGQVGLSGAGGGIDRNTALWIPHGSSVGAGAYPASGYIFTGWAPLYGQPSPVDTSPYVIRFVMNGPQQLQPFFHNARPVQVTLQPNPRNCQIFADRTPYYQSITLEWGWDTTHTVGAPPAQNCYDGGLWTFDSWSDGGAINHDFQMPIGYTVVTLTANLIPAATVSFITTPNNLNLTIDGRQNWPSYNFIWGVNSSHQIIAPATQTDAQGHKYQFVSWSNGRTASFTYTMPETRADDTLTAKYQALGQVTLNSVPSQLQIQVEGASCITPCTIEKPAGTILKVVAPASMDLSPNSRLLFKGWNDGADASRQFTISPDARTYTITYQQQNRLTVAANPAEGASISINPSSPDGFYDAGSLVSISAQLALGFRFAGWSGDVSSATTSTAIALDAPKSALLMLDRVPAIAPGSVRNAAAPVTGIVPGSLISVFGANLAPALEIGSSNPLPQTLQNVTVRTEDAFLPLVFVSSGQINAQLPQSVSEGLHTLYVRWEGKGETSSQVRVVRNAPGLFNNGSTDQPLGSFLKSGGQAATVDNPAHGGDTLSVLGTGFGPYTSLPPDGFLLDDSAGYTLADTVTVVMEDGTELASSYAGRSGAAVGVDAARFQLPANLPDGQFLKLRIRVNGQDSNTVLLPVSR